MIRDHRAMQPRARVLAVLQSANPGGAEIALLRIAPLLEARGIDLEFTLPARAHTWEVAGTWRLPVGATRAGSWPRAVLAWPRARRLARRYDAVILNGIATQRLAPAMSGPALVPWIHEWVDRGPRAWRSHRFWRSAPRVLCSSAPVAMRCATFGAPRDRLRVVHAPVGSAPPAPRPDWADGPVVGCVGRIEEAKGMLDVVRAMQGVDARLVVVGDGSGSYAAHVRREAGERAVFTGHVADARALMPWFDVLAVASRSESFGLVAAEALASGTPVVAMRCGGIEEFVVPGRNGDLVPSGDVEGLGAALRRVIPRAAEMESPAREDAARFAPERVADGVAAALRDAIARRPA
jgi:glycosyltransferase involved in cell wall biosynthesis